MPSLLLLDPMLLEHWLCQCFAGTSTAHGARQASCGRRSFAVEAFRTALAWETYQPANVVCGAAVPLHLCKSRQALHLQCIILSVLMLRPINWKQPNWS